MKRNDDPVRGPTEYHFTHTGVVPADPGDVQARLVDLEHYPDWWPQVRAVAKIDDDQALVVCRSMLPYDLELHLTAVSRGPRLLEVHIDGPLQGWSRWILTAVPDGTRLDYEQRVRVVSRRLSWASYLLRPLLRWNHAKMMEGAERGLSRALR